MSLKHRFFLPILSGLLIALAYIPFYPILGLIALVPLWLAMDQARSYREVFLQSWWSQFIFSLIGFHWVAQTAHDFGYLPWSLSVLVLVGFASLVHLHFCLAGCLWFFLKNRFMLTGFRSDLLKLVCLFLTESYWPMIFPWNFGYSWLSSSLWLAQTAELWGFVGLSFWVMLSNVYIKNFGLLLQARQLTKAGWTMLIWFSFFIAFNALGYILKTSVPGGDRQLHIGVVQANIGNFEKIQAEHSHRFQDVIVDKYLQASERLLQTAPNLDLLVWPETAIPVSVDSRNPQHYLLRRIETWLAEKNLPLLSGVFYRDSHIYNGAGLWLPSQGLQQSYKKSLLLAWGETVPFTENFPSLQRQLQSWIPALSFFGKGSGPVPLPLNSINLGLQICYEGIHPDFVRELKNQGAQIFINLTNDSWFGKYFEPYQHMYMTLARSIEHRIPSLRVTNTGISTAIAADGSLLQRSPIGEEWVGSFSLAVRSLPPTTLYQRIGAAVPWLLSLVTLMAIVILQRNKQKSSSIQQAQFVSKDV